MVDAGGFADDFGCGQRPATRQGQQSWGQLLDQLRDLFLQGIDHGGELGAPAGQFSRETRNNTRLLLQPDLDLI
jgi:hypothetical protein